MATTVTEDSSSTSQPPNEQTQSTTSQSLPINRPPMPKSAKAAKSAKILLPSKINKKKPANTTAKVRRLRPFQHLSDLTRAELFDLSKPLPEPYVFKYYPYTGIQRDREKRKERSKKLPVYSIAETQFSSTPLYTKIVSIRKGEVIIEGMFDSQIRYEREKLEKRAAREAARIAAAEAEAKQVDANEAVSKRADRQKRPSRQQSQVV